MSPNFGVEHVRVKVVADLIEDSDPGHLDTPGELTFWAYGVRFIADVEITDTYETNAHWTFGFIQGIQGATANYKYGEDGELRRECHPLISGEYTCINDGDGSAFPFFDCCKSMIDIPPGEVRKGSFRLEFSDWPYTSVGNESLPLTKVDKTCERIVWLAAIKWSKKPKTPDSQLENDISAISFDNDFQFNRDEIHVFCSYSWKSSIVCTLNTRAPIGCRVRDMTFNLQEKPKLLRDNTIYQSVLSRPTYMSSLASLWYPARKKQVEILEFPLERICDWNSWIQMMIPQIMSVMCNEDQIKFIRRVDVPHKVNLATSKIENKKKTPKKNIEFY